MSSSQYTPLADDSDRESSQLLPTHNNFNLDKFGTAYSITFNPLLLVRILSTILALVAFIILVIDGGEEFIAADIFLMFIILVNFLIIIHYFVSNVLKVTVELRQQAWQADLAPANRPTTKVSRCFDIGLASVAFLCLIIGSSIGNSRWGGGAWHAAVIIGYIVVLLQILLAVPKLDGKKLTLTAKLSDAKGKVPEDTKAPAVVDETERGSARRRATEPEQQRQNAEDNV